MHLFVAAKKYTSLSKTDDALWWKNGKRYSKQMDLRKKCSCSDACQNKVHTAIARGVGKVTSHWRKELFAKKTRY